MTAVLLVLTHWVVAVQQDPPAAAAPAGADLASDQVAAKVDGESIQVAEVERELAIAVGERTLTDPERRELLARTLEQLINRRLAQRWLSQTNQAAAAAEVDVAVERLRNGLKQRGSSLDAYLAAQRLDANGLRRALAWQIGWQRYLDKQLSDQNLERYFAAHRRDFDGTQLRVAQVFFRVSPPDSAEIRAAAQEKARQLLAQIRAGSITFAAAARAHSDSPSRDQGGDIGLISRREPMPEAFSRAAFALDVQQISEPVDSAIGVHLIQCLEILPGQKRWVEVRGELESAVTQYLFDWITRPLRPTAKLHYSADFPHFASGTERLAEPVAGK